MDAFYALAEPRRRRIMEILASSGQLPATEIYKRFDVTAQAVSQHLRILLDAKLVRMEKRARQHIYEINTLPMHEMEDWLKRTEVQWNQRLDRLEMILESEKRNAKKR